MDDQAAMLARRVALSASAWLNGPADVDVYRRLVAAVGEWDEYCGPAITSDEGGDEELLDGLAEMSPPVPLGEGVAELEARLRRGARQQL